MASELKPVLPSTLWQHYNGNKYEVLLLSNTESERQEKYPTTVVYRNISNRNIYSRKLSDWHRSMTHVEETRPAPAATDTGLVTIAKLGGINGVMLVRHIENLRPEAQAAYKDELVRRSQTEELLAAERSRADANFDKAIEQGKRAVDLEAKLAAKDARIKELTGDRDSWRRVAEKLAGEKQALEAKLAAATDLISRAKEIIPDSYINWHDFARAALGGKP